MLTASQVRTVLSRIDFRTILLERAPWADNHIAQVSCGYLADQNVVGLYVDIADAEEVDERKRYYVSDFTIPNAQNMDGLFEFLKSNIEKCVDHIVELRKKNRR